MQIRILTEVDSLERLVRSLGSVFLGALIICSCSTSDPILWVLHGSQNLEHRKGLSYLNSQILDAVLYELNAQGDTSFIHPYSQGKAHGEWREYYPQNRLKRSVKYLNGKKTGSSMGFWQNGLQMTDYNYLNGEFHGRQEEFNDVGKLIRIMNYDMGHESGEQKLWYDNGELKSNYVVKDGRRFGLLGTKNCVNVTDSIF